MGDVINFAQTQERMRHQNYLEIMSKYLIPYYTDLFISNGLSASDVRVWNIAQEAFCHAKSNGKLDSLNRLKEAL